MLDETDARIISLLQENAKLTIKEVAEALHLTTSPVFERIKRLEREEVIERYVALVNPEKVGRGQVVFCNVHMPIYTTAHIEAFEEWVRALPHVLECYHLAGTVDYQLKVVVKDIKEYDAFLKQLAEVPMVKVHSSLIALHDVKNSTIVPIN